MLNVIERKQYVFFKMEAAEHISDTVHIKTGL